MTLRHAFAALALAAAPAAADTAGDFDYYVLALSWSPTWCGEDARRGSEDQCRLGRDFVVHGLWPQYEQGWPQDCATRERDPSRRESQAMGDIMGSGGLAWYQWQKHGRCTGLSAAGYYDATRAAAEAVTLPPVFRGLFRDLTLPPSVVEDAFLDVNPDMTRDGITVACRDGQLTEVRICLDRDLAPRDCAPDARRDCRTPRIGMDAVR